MSAETREPNSRSIDIVYRCAESHETAFLGVPLGTLVFPGAFVPACEVCQKDSPTITFDNPAVLEAALITDGEGPSDRPYLRWPE